MVRKERHIHEGFLGHLTWDPEFPESGTWWYNTRERVFKFYNGQLIILEAEEDTPVEIGGTYTHYDIVPGDALGRPNTNPPTVSDQDNLTLYNFTLNTDRMTFKFPVPLQYDSGPMEISVVWTNDGGGDDNGTNVTWQLQYQTGSEGDIISGNHANSPKWVNDTYTSGFGFVEHHTDYMAIGQADFEDESCMFFRIMAITPPAPALTCEPRLIGICRRYLAKRIFV